MPECNERANVEAAEADRVSLVPNEGWDERVRAFRCGTTVDSFAVVTDRYLVLVDTMVDRRSIETVVEELAGALTGRSLLAVNTHGDWDHVWGNGLFQGPEARYPAPIIGHRRAAERIASPEAATFLASYKEEHPGRYLTAGLFPPTIRFEGELELDGGDLTVELLPTPGHTPDHVSIWIPQIRTLLAGDAAELPFPLVSDPNGLENLRASLYRMEALNPRTVLYSHANGITDPGLIRQNIAYFDELERRCRDTLVAGRVPVEGSREPAKVIEWPFEEALPPGLTIDDLPSPGFYRRAHDQAIEAMLTWLRRETTTLHQ